MEGRDFYIIFKNSERPRINSHARVPKSTQDACLTIPKKTLQFLSSHTPSEDLGGLAAIIGKNLPAEGY